MAGTGQRLIVRIIIFEYLRTSSTSISYYYMMPRIFTEQEYIVYEEILREKILVTSMFSENRII